MSFGFIVKILLNVRLDLFQDGLMQLAILGKTRVFTAINVFRKQYNLPEDFSILLFQPKNFAGLGRIDAAGKALNAVKLAILDYIPDTTPVTGWSSFMLELQVLFRQKLVEVNPVIGLKPEEIDFAVSGFSDVAHLMIYSSNTARIQQKDFPTFETVYAKWVNSTVEISRWVFIYPHNGEEWKVRPVRNVYGVIGMIVTIKGEEHYVYDPSRMCPAEGFMFSLLAEITDRKQSTMKQTMSNPHVDGRHTHGYNPK